MCMDAAEEHHRQAIHDLVPAFANKKMQETYKQRMHALTCKSIDAGG